MALSTRTQSINANLSRLIYTAHGMDPDSNSKIEGESKSAQAFRNLLQQIKKFPKKVVIPPFNLNAEVLKQITLLKRIAVLRDMQDGLFDFARDKVIADKKKKKKEILDEIKVVTANIMKLSPASITSNYAALELQLTDLDLDIVHVENRNSSGAEKNFDSRIEKLEKSGEQEKIRNQFDALSYEATGLVACLHVLAGKTASFLDAELCKLESNYKAICPEAEQQKQEEKRSAEQVVTVTERINSFVRIQIKNIAEMRELIKQKVEDEKNHSSKINVKLPDVLQNITSVKKNDMSDDSHKGIIQRSSLDLIIDDSDQKKREWIRPVISLYESMENPQLIAKLDRVPERLNILRVRANNLKHAAPDLSSSTWLLGGAGALGAITMGAVVFALCLFIFGIMTMTGIGVIIPGVIGAAIAWRMHVHATRGLERENNLRFGYKSPGSQYLLNEQNSQQRAEAEPKDGFINKLLGESTSSRNERMKQLRRGHFRERYNKPAFQDLEKVPASDDATEERCLILNRGENGQNFSGVPAAYISGKGFFKPIPGHAKYTKYVEMPSDDEEYEKELSERVACLK